MLLFQDNFLSEWIRGNPYKYRTNESAEIPMNSKILESVRPVFLIKFFCAYFSNTSARTWIFVLSSNDDYDFTEFYFLFYKLQILLVIYFFSGTLDSVFFFNFPVSRKSCNRFGKFPSENFPSELYLLILTLSFP